jgi:hypothetical protein
MNNEYVIDIFIYIFIDFFGLPFHLIAKEADNEIAE